MVVAAHLSRKKSVISELGVRQLFFNGLDKRQHANAATYEIKAFVKPQNKEQLLLSESKWSFDTIFSTRHDYRATVVASAQLFVTSSYFYAVCLSFYGFTINAASFTVTGINDANL